ncbi:hypothetical protein V6N12_001223 [Hibiscus sabdariffa]|uniref:Amino acid transporter transmembrane domain-containing protein n=1 Tax=Hibiscus sabdariffa TaxID=183260 RepID=A0ABR2C6L5_9ROSI
MLQVLPQSHAVSNLVLYILDLCGKDWTVSFHHVLRFENRVTDSLAKLVRWDNLGIQIYHRPPSSITHLLQADAPPLLCREAYYLTWALQYVNLFMINLGYLILGGSALKIFASPAYEYLDTKFGVSGSSLKVTNIAFRVVARGSYLIVSTLVSALLPFLGDFETLTGALSTFPLTFILANHMYLVAKKKKKRLSSLQEFWHWLNVGFFGLMSLAATIAGIRLIAVDSKEYHIFADV